MEGGIIIELTSRYSLQAVLFDIKLWGDNLLFLLSSLQQKPEWVS